MVVKRMKVSVVLPTRNAEWCLPYALESLLKQKTQPDEYVICIGKSEDNTEKIVLNFSQKCPVPVKICYDREGIGTGYAMNLLMKEATGDIILWASSDGTKNTHWIERMKMFFEENEDITYLCNSGMSDSPKNMSLVDPEKISFDNKLKIIKGVDALAGILAFRRDVALSVGNFDILFTRGQDLDMVIRFAQSGKIGANCGLQGYHFGVYGSRNLTKAFKTGTFFKFIYKYGWRYCLINTHHFAGVVLRTVFLFSTVMFLLGLLLGSSLTILFGYTLLLSIIGLYFGVFISHGKLSLNLLVFQFLESIGEYNQLWLLIKNKNKLEMGYGKKWLK